MLYGLSLMDGETRSQTTRQNNVEDRPRSYFCLFLRSAPQTRICAMFLYCALLGKRIGSNRASDLRKGVRLFVLEGSRAFHRALYKSAGRTIASAFTRLRSAVRVRQRPPIR